MDKILADSLREAYLKSKIIEFHEHFNFKQVTCLSESNLVIFPMPFDKDCLCHVAF
jgi:hypothetical protein